jgi:flagellar motor protein MotB
MAPPAVPDASASSDYLALILGRTLGADAPSPGIAVRRSGDGLAIVFTTALLFPAGDAELTPVMAGRLRHLTPSLPPQFGPVHVFGVGAGSGTDADRALALQRALAVASVISSGADRRPAVAYGFGSSAAALSWLRLAAASPAAPAATAIVMDAGGEAR